MRIEFVESLSIPGAVDRPNEDSWIASDRVAAVFDGATGLGETLMPGRSDAQWIAQFGARRLRAHAEDDAGGLRDWLRAAAADAEKSFTALRKRPPIENYEVAYASAVMTTASAGELCVLWFGDCAALLRTQTGDLVLIGDTLDKRASERVRVNRLARPGGRGPAAAGVRDEFLPALRTARNAVNRGSDWLFGPDANCADHAKEKRVRIVPGALVLLASDGFLALVSDYARYTPTSLFDAVINRGVAPLGEELRRIEAADPDGIAYPRFKRSDDATALLLRVAV